MTDIPIKSIVLGVDEIATDQNFDEERYLSANPDVRLAVKNASFPSGRAHYDHFGKREGRRLARIRNANLPVFRRQRWKKCGRFSAET
jgi:hypothetical protein